MGVELLCLLMTWPITTITVDRLLVKMIAVI